MGEIVKSGQEKSTFGLNNNRSFATLDTSSLTGESLPLEVEKGMDILSGCVNTNGSFKLKSHKRIFWFNQLVKFRFGWNSAGRKITLKIIKIL